MNMNKQNIETEIREVLPSPSQTVVDELTTVLLTEGMNETLPTWNGILLDGFIRRDICKRHRISFETKDVLGISSAEEAKNYRLIRNFSAIRQISPAQRAVVVLSQKDFWSKKVKNRMRLSKGRGIKGSRKIGYLFDDLLEKCKDKNGKIKTNRVLARIAQVSESTIEDMDFIRRRKHYLINEDESGLERWNQLEQGLFDGTKSINSVKHTLKRVESSHKKSTNQFSSEYINSSDWVNQILNMDALDGMQRIPDESVHLIIFSPPYHGVQCDYEGTYDTEISYAEYLNQLEQVFKECQRVLVQGGRVCINTDEIKCRKEETNDSFVYDVCTDISVIMKEKVGLKKTRPIVWYKQNAPGKKTGWGNTDCPSIRSNHEYILVFCKGDDLLRQRKYASDLPEDKLSEFTLSTWVLPPDMKGRKLGHPYPFPEELAYRLIKLWSYPNDVVLDPFNGSGTTTAVACREKRLYCGIERVASYCNMAKHRINEVSPDFVAENAARYGA